MVFLKPLQHKDIDEKIAEIIINTHLRWRSLLEICQLSTPSEVLFVFVNF
ncbi:hypothetical protein GTQ43_03035 [Nostoc sp. KVJ3]|nr:hypothetical protein [Nostoc sp. KVJ3]MCW5312858.1 hypothetical protein [Nostoc sp. KVJ3]